VLDDVRASMEMSSRLPFGAIPTLHFACLVVIPDSAAPVPGRKPGPEPSAEAVVVFENNFDGDLDTYLPQLLSKAGATVHDIFGCSDDYGIEDASRTEEISAYLRAHAVHPAAFHVGSFGRSADRIRDEGALFVRMQKGLDSRLAGGDRPPSDAAAYALIREVLAADDEATALAGRRYERPGWWDRVGPWVRLVGVGAVAVAVVVAVAFVALWLPLVVLAVYVLVLLRHEATDVQLRPDDIDRGHAQAMAQLEDRPLRVQNHFVSITNVKPSAFRRISLRVVLWAANLVARTSTHGTLSGIPSIHYAHWALLDGGKRLLFLSNFDGSWESYLDDFIDKASVGLTGIWTHSDGFPKTRLLFGEGARNGGAFKAYARASQVGESVWYAAYPRLTVQQIDTHSAVRDGLASAVPAGALRAWLARW
jgi:hypothetical protein